MKSKESIMRKKATYKDIQLFYYRLFGVKIKTNWIADVKRENIHYPMRISHHRTRPRDYSDVPFDVYINIKFILKCLRVIR